MLKAGFYEKNITPPLGGHIPGFFLPRVADDVLADLYARAVVIDNGKEKVAMLALDMLGLDKHKHAELIDYLKTKRAGYDFRRNAYLLFCYSFYLISVCSTFTLNITKCSIPTASKRCCKTGHSTSIFCFSSVSSHSSAIPVIRIHSLDSAFFATI